MEFVYRKLESKLVEKEKNMSARENQEKNRNIYGKRYSDLLIYKNSPEIRPIVKLVFFLQSFYSCISFGSPLIIQLKLSSVEAFFS